MAKAKMKTKSGAKKRVTIMGSGHAKRAVSFGSHNFTGKKSPARKRKIRLMAEVSESSAKELKRALPYG